MKLVSRLLANPDKIEDSPSIYGEKGYRNWFGGFHFIQDRTAYFKLIKLILTKPWDKNYWKLGTRYIWNRWVHRSCDTTDFHHNIYCELDPWVRKREIERTYVETWRGRWDMRNPGEAFCAVCPDHEACATGAPCSLVREVNK